MYNKTWLPARWPRERRATKERSHLGLFHCAPPGRLPQIQFETLVDIQVRHQKRMTNRLKHTSVVRGHLAGLHAERAATPNVRLTSPDDLNS